MATVAGLAKTAMMRVVLPMTADAASHRFTELLARRMTAAAACSAVTAGQREVGPSMIEQPCIDRDDIGVSALVIGVTDNAFFFLGGGKTAVKTGTRLAITADIFMATHAQGRAGLVGAGVMTGRTVFFDVRMSFDNPSGHQQPFQTRRVYGGAGENNKYKDRERADT